MTVLAADHVGRLIADRMLADRPSLASDSASAGAFEAALDRSGPAVLATGRPGSAATARLAAQHRQLLIVGLEPGRLRAAVVTGSLEHGVTGGCFACFAGRSELDSYYDGRPADRPAGYLPHQLDLAAQAGFTLLDRAASGPSLTLVFDLFDNSLRTAPAGCTEPAGR
ncbi:MAG: hypothetical protein ABI140_19085 [Jatrophihabitantaceae bacterium]